MSKFYLLPYSEWPEEEKEKKRNFARAWINIKENKLRRYQTSLLKFYNLTWENYVKILEQQEYLCAICGKQLVVPGQGEYNGNDTAVVDHNHETGVVRGILCRKCNKALGGFGDEISIIKKAFNYLEGNRDGYRDW